MRATSSSGLGSRALSISLVLVMVSTGFFVFVSVGPETTKNAEGCGPGGIWSTLVVGMNAGDGTHSNQDELLKDLLSSRYVDVDFHFTKRGAVDKYLPSAKKMGYYDLVIFYTDPGDQSSSGYKAWGTYTHGWENISEYCEDGGRVMVLLNGDYSAYYLASPYYGKQSVTQEYLGWTSCDYQRDHHYWHGNGFSWGYLPDWPLYGQPGTSFEWIGGWEGELSGSDYFWSQGYDSSYSSTRYGYSPYPYANAAKTLLYTDARDDYNHVPVSCAVGYDAGDWRALTHDFAWFNLNEDYMETWFYHSLVYLQVPQNIWYETPIVSEIYDEGEPGEDQFIELSNPLWSDFSLDLSRYYLSVIDEPEGEGDAYGNYDLTSYDDDGSLDVDEYIVVTDEELDLGKYKRIGLYWKEGKGPWWHSDEESYPAFSIGWGSQGESLDPVAGLSAQFPWDVDNERYTRDGWTLARSTRGVRNDVPFPDFESYKLVINEVNPGYVELYNTGASQRDIGGYKVAGYRNAYTFPSGTTIAPGGYYTVPNSKLLIADNGGDMKLLTELGVLIDVFSWAPSDTRVDNSYGARHLDGVGVRDVYVPGQGSNYQRRELEQRNSWWDLDATSTQGLTNYEGATIFIDGMEGVFHYLNNTDDQGDHSERYKGGILEAGIDEVATLTPWDVVLFNGDVDDAVAQKLRGYLQNDGRLYLESDDFQTMGQKQEHFYDMLHIRSFDFVGGTLGESLLAGDLFAESIELKYDGDVGERIDPLDDALRIMYQKSGPTNRFMAGYIENPTTGYRVVSSALEVQELVADRNEPTDFFDALVEWFLTEDLNNAPVIELIDGGQVGSTPLTANNAKLRELGWLGWENHDPDHWDQGVWETRDAYDHEMYKFVDFSVYIDQGEDKVKDLDPRCQILAQTNTSFYLPSGLEPGKYFWTVVAQDRYNVVGGYQDDWGDPISFSFYYDNKKPMMDSIRPYFQGEGGVAQVGNEMLGYYTLHGEHPSFGPGGEGKPEGILMTVSDEHLGVAFDGSPRTTVGLRFVSTTPGVAGKTFEEVPLKTRAGGAIETLHAANEAEFILNLTALTLEEGVDLLDDDGTLRDGRYAIMYEIYDFVGNLIEGSLIFTVDASFPEAVTELYIKAVDHHIFVNSGVKYLKAGENYQIFGIGPTTALDGTLDGIAFYMVDKLSNPAPVLLGSFEGNDIAGARETQRYDVEFEAVAGYEFFYAVTVDRAGNEVVSGFLGNTGNYVVDAYAPTRPYGLEVRKDVQEYVTVTGWARDYQVTSKTSGMSYVLVYVNREVVRWENDGTYDWLGGMEYQAGDEMKVLVIANQFSARVPLVSVSNRDGDIKNVIQVRGVDNVGNKGDLSLVTELAPIRMLDPLRSTNVVIREQATGLCDGVDQLNDMSVTFLQFAPGDFEYHTIAMTYHAQAPDVDVSAISMLGYWTVETDVKGDVTARIRIEFQHPSFSGFDFDKLQLVSKSGADTNWRALEDAVFVHQEANPAAGIHELWYVEVTVNSLSDFAIIQGRPDLQIVDTHVFANPLVIGQTVRISATVRNVGEFAPAVEGVRVRVYSLDERGAEVTIGWIEFKDAIMPGKDNQQTGEVTWEPPIVNYAEKLTFYVRFKLDPYDEIAEYNEGNNNGIIDEDRAGGEDPIEVLTGLGDVPSFASTMFTLVLAGILVAGCAAVTRKRRH